MNYLAKFIDEKRYKKVTRKQFQKDKENLRKRNIESRKLQRESNVNIKHSRNSNKKKNTFFRKMFKIGIILILIFSVSYISKIIMKKDDSDSIQTISSNNKVVTLVQDYDFKIGMTKLDTTNYLNTKNALLSELVGNVSNVSLIKFDDEYNIKYEVASDIEKVSNGKYEITVNSNYKIGTSDIRNAVKRLIDAGKHSLYYVPLSNIDSIVEKKDKKIEISLKKEDPYFVYYLDFPIILDEYSYFRISVKDNEVIFNRNKSNFNQISTINFKSFESIDNLVEEFKKGNIDMFPATSDIATNLIGKYDYNVKKFRNGETVFLLGNNDSELFLKKEVRQALSYVINRDEIIKDVNPKFSEVIDIPYIYSKVKYKYDITRC